MIMLCIACIEMVGVSGSDQRETTKTIFRGSVSTMDAAGVERLYANEDLVSECGFPSSVPVQLCFITFSISTGYVKIESESKVSGLSFDHDGLCKFDLR